MFAIVAGEKPGDHVLLGRWGVGQHQHELGLGLAWQAHVHIVGLDAHPLTRYNFLRPTPQILLIVKDLGIGHVEGLKLGRLNAKHPLRITPVSYQRRIHVFHWPEQIGKDGSIGRYQGIARIDQIEGERPVVGIQRHLD